MKARSDLMCFWKLLSDCEFTGSPSSLTEDQVRAMAEAKACFLMKLRK
jgi:hypothetical protein